MKLILQSESQECSLACLAMISNYHGLHHDLLSLRRKFSVSLKGANLSQLIKYSHDLNFSSRSLRLDLGEIKKLRCPCILHWDMNHFVVLKKVVNNVLHILDPAMGARKVTVDDASTHFTGVALELVPNNDFAPEQRKPKVRLRNLIGRAVGFKRALVNIFIIAVAIEVVALLSPQVTQWVVDGALVSADYDLLLLAVLGGGLLLIIDFFLKMVRGWMGLRLNQQLSLQWSSNLMRHLVTLPWPFFERRHLGDITSRFQSLSAIRQVFANGAIMIVLDGFVAIITFGMMLMYSHFLTMVVVVALALYLTLRVVFYQPLRNASEERIILSSRENAYFLETLRAIVPLKLFNHSSIRLSNWQNMMVDVQNRDVTTQKILLVFSSLNTLIFGLENMFLLYWGAF